MTITRRDHAISVLRRALRHGGVTGRDGDIIAEALHLAIRATGAMPASQQDEAKRNDMIDLLAVIRIPPIRRGSASDIARELERD
jgi:hypothetical protein